MNLGHCYTPASAANLPPFPSAFLTTGHRRLPSAISEQGGEGCPAEPRFGGQAFSSSLSLTSLPYASISRCIVLIPRLTAPFPGSSCVALMLRNRKRQRTRKPKISGDCVESCWVPITKSCHIIPENISLSFSSVAFQRPQDCQPLSVAPSTQFTLYTDIQHPGLSHKQTNKHLLTLGLLCGMPTRQTLFWERCVYSC